MQISTILKLLPSPKLVLNALIITLHEKKSKWILFISFSILLLFHLTILPAHILGMDIGLSSFFNLTANIVLFSLLLALSESTLICMWFYLIKHKTQCKTAPAAGGVTIGIITPLLCCSPILPSILSFIAILFPSAISGMGMKVQYMVNVYQTGLLIFALILLLIAIYQNAKFITAYSERI